MKIVCVPIAENRGLLSPVALQFASAPMFLLVDTSTLAFRAIPNTPQRQKDRGCDPCTALEDVPVDAVIVAAIDARLLVEISRRRVPVYGGASGTVADALAAFIGGRLSILGRGDGVSTSSEEGATPRSRAAPSR